MPRSPQMWADDMFATLAGVSSALPPGRKYRRQDYIELATPGYTNQNTMLRNAMSARDLAGLLPVVGNNVVKFFSDVLNQISSRTIQGGGDSPQVRRQANNFWERLIKSVGFLPIGNLRTQTIETGIASGLQAIDEHTQDQSDVENLYDEWSTAA